MPLSRLDLPAIRGAVSDLYRILEDPSPTNAVAVRVYRRSTARTTQGEQNPDGVVPGALIRAGTDELVRVLGGHYRDQCPELADAPFDLETKAALLELRGQVIGPFVAHWLGTDSGLRVQFLVAVAQVLKCLETADPSANHQLPTPQPMPKALTPEDRVLVRAGFDRALAIVPEPHPTGPHGARAEAETRWRAAHGDRAEAVHLIADEWVREFTFAAIGLHARLETWPTVAWGSDDETVAFDVIVRAARLWEANRILARVRGKADVPDTERHSAAQSSTHDRHHLRELLMNLIFSTAARLEQFRSSIRSVVERLMTPVVNTPPTVPQFPLAPARKGPARTFPAPAGATWEDVTLTVEEHRLHVSAHAEARTFGFAEAGFENRRKKNAPDAVWVLLRVFARCRGTLAPRDLSPDDPLTTKPGALKAQVGKLRAALSALIGIEGNPFHRTGRGKPYRARFAVKLGGAVNCALPAGATWDDLTLTATGAGVEVSVTTDARGTTFAENGTREGCTNTTEREFAYTFDEMGCSDGAERALRAVLAGRGRVTRPSDDADLLALGGALTAFFGIEGAPPFEYVRGQWVATFEALPNPADR